MADRIDFVTDRSELAGLMDALTDVLQTVHLRGSLYFRSELTAPWGLAIPAAALAQFHAVRRGRCWLHLDRDASAEPLPLEPGDLVILPQGDAHRLTSAPTGVVPEPLERVVQCHQKPGAPKPLVYGGGGAAVTLICGYFVFEAARPGVHPLLSVLPPLISLQAAQGRGPSWLESILDLIAAEAADPRPGSETVVDRLTETLFIQVLRSYLESEAASGPSWLAGLRDPRIAEALGLMHREPAERWSVESLATRVGMSRTSFANRFRELVGETPLRYLARWRMQRAAQALRDGSASLPEIAERVGYRAEAAFSKVFKKMWGVAPGQYRRQAIGAGQLPQAAYSSRSA